MRLCRHRRVGSGEEQTFHIRAWFLRAQFLLEEPFILLDALVLVLEKQRCERTEVRQAIKTFFYNSESESDCQASFR